MSGSDDKARLVEAEVAVHDGVVVVTFTGEIDMVNAADARSVLQRQLEALPPGLVVDLAVGFLDSVGLLLLVETQQHAQENGTAFGVVAAGYAARRPLEISGLDKALLVFGDVMEAVKSLRENE